MSFASNLKKASTFVYDKFAGNPGKLLLYTGTFGWILSSLGQLFGIAINDKIPTEQKKFLIPQEMADAAVNIASFFVLTKSVTDFSENLVKSGKLATPKIRQLLKKYHLDEKIGTKGFDITDTPEMKALGTEFKKDLHDEFYNLADGVSFIGSTIGSIISCNIITPILRNKFAADRQKQAIAQEKLQAQNEAIAPYTPVLPYQNRVGIDDYKSKVLSGAGVKVSNGSMKI